MVRRIRFDWEQPYQASVTRESAILLTVSTVPSVPSTYMTCSINHMTHERNASFDEMLKGAAVPSAGWYGRVLCRRRAGRAHDERQSARRLQALQDASAQAFARDSCRATALPCPCTPANRTTSPVIRPAFTPETGKAEVQRANRWAIHVEFLARTENRSALLLTVGLARNREARNRQALASAVIAVEISPTRSSRKMSEARRAL